jgi:hypothetical protein
MHHFDAEAGASLFQKKKTKKKNKGQSHNKVILRYWRREGPMTSCHRLLPKSFMRSKDSVRKYICIAYFSFHFYLGTSHPISCIICYVFAH